ncbi:hypothetical protein V1291_001272 [Nitrobacteraceae bacterium AZCC 1564]
MPGHGKGAGVALGQRQLGGAAACAERFDPVSPAFEIARQGVGCLASQIVDGGIGFYVDIGDVAYRSRRQSRYDQHLLGDRAAGLVLVGNVRNVPALDLANGFPFRVNAIRSSASSN